MSQDETRVQIRLTEDHGGHKAGDQIAVTPYIAEKLVDRASIAERVAQPAEDAPAATDTPPATDTPAPRPRRGASQGTPE